MGVGEGRIAAVGLRKRAGPRRGVWKRAAAVVGRRVRALGRVQTVVGVRWLGRKRAAKVLVRCLCRASLVYK